MQYLSTSQFIDKYKLIPKNLRKNFLDYTYSIIKKGNIIDELSIHFILDILYLYEKDNEYSDNNTELNFLLLETIESDGSYFYSYLTDTLKYYMNKNKIVTEHDIFSFRKKVMLKSIKEEVAYRPGNIGYEILKEHFYSTANKLIYLKL